MFEIGEQSSLGTRFQLNAARDPDAGVNSIRTYTLTANYHFDIEINQSDEDKVPFLVLKKSLDREEKNQHLFFLTAVDGGKPPKSGILNVSIIVLDNNDNRPKFSKEIYQIEIQENTSIGTTLTRISAADPDEGTNGEIEYSLSKTLERKVYDLFRLDRVSGEITLKERLDFEDSDTYKLDVQASDKGQPPLIGRCRLIVKIKDVNDNAPEIEVTSLSNTVSEDSKPGTVVSLISVTDKDTGVNGKVVLQITEYVPFELKPSYKENIYSVVTKSLLDREQVSLYEINIKATDCGEPPLAALKTLSIHISDVNDNSPNFSQNPLHFYLSENNVAGASVFSVSATDNDVNDNAAISYHIVREHDVTTFLNINSENGQISALKSFDFEILKTFQFQVVATDSGAPSLSSNVTVNVFILDQNDNPPVILYPILVENPLEMHHVIVEIIDVNDHSPTFPKMHQRFEIAEHTSVGTRFQLQAARDPDAGVNSIRTYTLSSNDHFDIDLSQSDEEKIPFLVLRKSLDREQNNEHLLFLTAVDGGKPPKSGTLNVSIIVLDINDNRPSFSQNDYQIEVYENASIGTVVARMNAKDPDEGINGEIKYSLSKVLASKVYTIFELDSLTGEIKLKGTLDFEESEIYKLDIEASDKATPPLLGRCRMIIKIKDVNDNSPHIDVTSLSNTVSEDSKPGTVISLISVTDKDSGVNGNIILRITNDVPFELKPSYKENIYSLVTKEHLDREKVSHYEITLLATDCGDPQLSTITSLSIQISDVNDNSPRFEQSPLQVYLSENNIAGGSFFSVSATDDDVNENAAITYHIARQTDVTTFLNINSENGLISALKSFDFETLKTFQFRVVATDSGAPSLSSNVTVNVFILDQNDNAPVILYPVSSNGSAEAYDADIGYNGWLLFSLQEVTDHSLFGLDRYTGQIRTLRSFTETDEAEHKLLILVKDNGNVSLSATATVLVKLVEPKEAFAASDVKSASKDDEENNVTFYLIITLGSVSVLFLISIIVLIAMQCSKTTDYTSKYLGSMQG
uniref:Si:ch73-379j16.2 n=1 Tax=Kryptolebias marmoratus TaxID=37003 RepID=A0A3Q3A6X5_KRYMA